MHAVELARSNALRLLVGHARAKPAAVAFRSKHLGLYRERTWRDYAAMVGRAALNLRETNRDNASFRPLLRCNTPAKIDLAPGNAPLGASTSKHGEHMFSFFCRIRS